MVAEVLFPIYVLAKDCGEVYEFASEAEVNGHLEAIDAENNEYDAWDASGRVLSLVAEGLTTWNSGRIRIEATPSTEHERFSEMRAKARPWSG